MQSNEIRRIFLDFFKAKGHQIVNSAPMVIKDDPTLMFTNAGMNQFKDIFLGNTAAKFKRVANTQKCLRVSGKHNDLEEVGHDTYHHTMFEMLGNWSFGDYFKKEAIEWAWELLTEVYKISPERLYATVFQGDEEDGLPADTEALNYWKNILPEEKVLFGTKKDNFWEMGDTGPCGPCSEIHIDLRDEEERRQTEGRTLINKGHPQVIEIWNLVFIEFNRLADGTLQPLPAKHIDTGMGFERLCMVVQQKKSNYDTDIFQPLIKRIAELAGKKYGQNSRADVAMRVIADHIRAISFAIADGQIPSNNKAGYVIRRILRRAVRYGYTFLGFTEPFIYLMVPTLVEVMGDSFPELKSQQDLIAKVIREEEAAFIRTLALGIAKFENYLKQNASRKIIDGRFAFELFDTYGFPVDLTQLMAAEHHWKVDMETFQQCMEEQKNRSRQAAAVDKEDWIIVNPDVENTEFVGYKLLQCEARIVRYRKIKIRNKEQYQLVLDRTPFYAESGGQVGDRGFLQANGNKIPVLDTVKENNLIIHITEKIPENVHTSLQAVVDRKKRLLTQNNHTATHLLHAALKKVLGDHVEQKGSLVNDEKLRFDFSHFSAVSAEDLRKIEKLVYEKITENIPVETRENVSVEEALKQGAVALFGEKYGDTVRVVTVDSAFSMELCGGTHVERTGQIGCFIITEESAIAAGIRRIEAVTGEAALDYIQQNLRAPLETMKNFMKRNFQELPEAVQVLAEQNQQLKKQVEMLQKEKNLRLKEDLKNKIVRLNDINFIAARIDSDSENVKDIAFALRNEVDNLFLALAWESAGKPGLALMLSENLVSGKNLNAALMIKELAKCIDGGGGGQAFYATAGGKKVSGIEDFLLKAKQMAESV